MDPDSNAGQDVRWMRKWLQRPHQTPNSDNEASPPLAKRPRIEYADALPPCPPGWCAVVPALYRVHTWAAWDSHFAHAVRHNDVREQLLVLMTYAIFDAPLRPLQHLACDVIPSHLGIHGVSVVRALAPLHTSVTRAWDVWRAQRAQPPDDPFHGDDTALHVLRRVWLQLVYVLGQSPRTEIGLHYEIFTVHRVDTTATHALPAASWPDVHAALLACRRVTRLNTNSPTFLVVLELLERLLITEPVDRWSEAWAYFPPTPAIEYLRRLAPTPTARLLHWCCWVVAFRADTAFTTPVANAPPTLGLRSLLHRWHRDDNDDDDDDDDQRQTDANDDIVHRLQSPPVPAWAAPATQWPWRDAERDTAALCPSPPEALDMVRRRCYSRQRTAGIIRTAVSKATPPLLPDRTPSVLDADADFFGTRLVSWSRVGTSVAQTPCCSPYPHPHRAWVGRGTSHGPWSPEEVGKGPYLWPADARSLQTLEQSHRRFDTLEQRLAPHGPRTALPPPTWVWRGTLEGGVHVVYAVWPALQTTPVRTWSETPFEALVYDVHAYPLPFHDAMWQQVWQHLYVRFLLGRGPVHAGDLVVSGPRGAECITGLNLHHTHRPVITCFDSTQEPVAQLFAKDVPRWWVDTLRRFRHLAPTTITSAPLEPLLEPTERYRRTVWHHAFDVRIQ